MTAPHVAVSALKLGEDGGVLAARLVELEGAPARGTVELPPLGSAPIEMGPSGIRTLLFPLGGGRPVREASLLEDETGGAIIDPHGRPSKTGDTP